MCEKAGRELVVKTAPNSWLVSEAHTQFTSEASALKSPLLRIASEAAYIAHGA